MEGPDWLTEVYEKDIQKVKTILLQPQCGSTNLDVNIFDEISQLIHSKRTVISIITDGAIDSNRTVLLNKMAELGKRKNVSIVFIEIANRSELGNDIRNTSGDFITYRYIDDVDKVGETLKTILVKY